MSVHDQTQKPMLLLFWTEIVFPDPSGVQGGNPMGTFCQKTKITEIVSNHEGIHEETHHD